MYSVDLGYGNIKVYSHDGGQEQFYKIKTTLESKSMKMDVISMLEKEDDLIKYENKYYKVGTTNVHSNNLFVPSPTFFIKYLPVFLRKVAIDNNLSDNEDIIIGLSYPHFIKYSDEFYKSAEFYNTHYQKNINIQFGIQGIGGYLALPQEIRERFKRKHFIILDIGFNTVDIPVIFDGVLVGEKFKVIEEFGMFKLIDIFREELINAKILSLTDSLDNKILEDVFLSGIFEIGFKNINVQVEKENAKSRYTEMLLDSITKLYGEKLLQDSVLVPIGGGAYHIIDNLRESGNELYIYDCKNRYEYLNAKGFYNFLSKVKEQQEQAVGQK